MTRKTIWDHPLMGPAYHDHLVYLHACGIPFSDIGSRLGITRSAAIGKAKRIGLKRELKIRPGGQLWRAVRGHGYKRVLVPVNSGNNPPFKKRLPLTHDHHRLIWDLGNCNCRWPLWRAGASIKEKLFCGIPDADADHGRPYCATHSVTSYKPDNRRG